jgi:hypothetical protein
MGGVDPSVIRELSGIYKPFPKAFKELVSNAYDADAECVRIVLSDACDSLQITDDGRGLTPDEFRTDFTKIGGSYTRMREGLTSKQRPKIGSKGIGFLAVARYCSKMEVISTTNRPHKATVRCRIKRRHVDLVAHLESPIQREMLIPRVSIHSITPVSLVQSKPFAKKYNKLNAGGFIDLSDTPRSSEYSEVEVEYSIDYKDMELHAIIDFEYLLSLENRKDLEQIDDFYSMRVRVLSHGRREIDEHFTQIVLHGLKGSVTRDLRAARRHGYVRNIESRSGLERFLWNLSRCVPAKYDLPPQIKERFGTENLESPSIKFIEKITFSGPDYKEVELTRPLWVPEGASPLRVDDDISIGVDINANGLVAKGYILGSSEIIYPAEYRGIAIRVRNVQIGAPSFLGFESVATGFVKAALSQITGEINVLQGMDAIDALNPGRESFYEENADFKLLKRHLVGDTETVGGLLGKVVASIWKRAQVLSGVNDQIQRANQRRKTLLNLAQAISHYSRDAGAGLRKLFSETVNMTNGLARLPAYELGPTKTIQGFRIENRQGVSGEQFTDFVNKTVSIDLGHDRWSWHISILGSLYEIVPKSGAESDPLCQLDTESKKIYINWGHPLRQQMGDPAFIKSAVAWKIAFHASQGKVENMMDLALKILSYNES